MKTKDFEIFLQRAIPDIFGLAMSLTRGSVDYARMLIWQSLEATCISRREFLQKIDPHFILDFKQDLYSNIFKLGIKDDFLKEDYDREVSFYRLSSKQRGVLYLKYCTPMDLKDISLRIEDIAFTLNSAEEELSQFLALKKRGSFSARNKCFHGRMLWGFSHLDANDSEFSFYVDHIEKCSDCLKLWREIKDYEALLHENIPQEKIPRTVQLKIEDHLKSFSERFIPKPRRKVDVFIDHFQGFSESVVLTFKSPIVFFSFGLFGLIFAYLYFLY